MIRATRPARPGTILPVLGLCLIGLVAFVALAIDIGLLAVSRTQCQNAADVSALVGCRNLNNKPGSVNNNLAAAVAATKARVAGSGHLSGYLQAGQIQSIEVGQYTYDPVSGTFKVGTWTDVTNAQTATPASGSWTAVRVKLNVTQPTFFMRVMGVNSMPSGAWATAVHRPRDVAFVLDMTGSMAYASTFNYSGPSLNPDALVPAFGHYTSVRSNLVATANQSNGSGEAISRNNFTITTPGGLPIVRDFYFDPANVSTPATPAFPVTSVAANLKNAFHRWSPPETGGDSTNYVGVTYDFTGYNAYDNGTEASPKGPTPAPDTFGTMTDSATTGVTYVGDRYRRADGSINKTNASWATGSTSTKAATNAVELLGYNVSGTNVRKGTAGTTAITTEDKFRDPVWEAYGYDLDVPKYRAWKTASNADNPATAAAYLTANGNNTANILVPAADRFQGFSMGPGYWGKTFYVWPPDPRAPVGNPGDAGYVAGDWRLRYFFRADGTAWDPQADNSGTLTGFDAVNDVLFNGTANGRTLSNGNFTVNYPAVLKWIKSGPQVLPPNLRAGRVLYYTSIPDDVNTATGTTQQVLDKVFWKRYIDYVVGNGYTSSTVLYGTGDSWSAAGTSIYTGAVNTWTGPAGTWSGTSVGSGARYPYMRYNDSPNRPRLHLWFGPLSVLDFVANSTSGNWFPGTCHEAQCWQLKAGMNSALDDIRNNRPNDWVGLTDFAYGSPAIYKNPRVGMGQNYTALKNALFYPKSLLAAINGGDTTTELRPYDANWTPVGGDEIPNANGSTDPNTGLAVAYNLLSPSAALPGTYGATRGRRGAAKVIIFETDGVPNSYSNLTFTKQGYNSYYSSLVNGGSPGNGVEPSMSNAVSVVQQIVRPMSTVTTGGVDSGLSLPNAPAKVYPIGFGDIFDPVSSPGATFRPTALQFLANLAYAGNTGSSGAATIPSGQIITGPYDARIATLLTCLETIFQSGISVTLIE